MKYSLFLAIFFFPLVLLAQSGVQGSTKSTNGEILPFATVYVKGTTNGTVSNGEGLFFLSLPAGSYNLIAQYVGYEPIEVELTVAEGQKFKLDFELKEQALTLETVVVTTDSEDPAYRIIREAIKKRKYYENELKAFRCDTYLKGSQRLDERPEKILGIAVTVDTGIVYLSESVSKLAFEKPNKVSEIMISSKVSGNDQGFSFNRASDFNINLYQKNFDFDGLVQRPLVSPISSQAFIFYDYELLGFFEENGEIINKIRLIPKRPSDPVFDGIIYIVENTWRVHTADLMVSKSRGVEFIDSLTVNQTLAPVEGDIWMPISQRFTFKFGAFGFKGSGYYVGVYSNYEVEPDYEYIEKNNSNIQYKSKKDLFDESAFSNEILKVEEGSNKRDSLYWEKIRPIPLTVTEAEDYVVKDSIRLVKESIPYKDSVDRESNKLTIGNVFLSGYTRSNSVEEKYWTIPSLLSLVQFNTVEGGVLEMQPTYIRQKKERTQYWIRPSFRYGEASEKFYSKLDLSYRRLDKKFTRFYLGGGQYVSQFSKGEPISPLINSYVTLMGENFMKLFQKSFAYFRFQQEVKNGIRFTGEVEYAIRDTLSNNRLDYYWAGTNDVNFTPNLPANRQLNNLTGFDTSHALIVDLKFRIRFAQKYSTRPDRKILYASDYPELNIQYKKGLNVLGSDVDFDFVKLTVSDEFNLGLFGQSKYIMSAGTFLNDAALTFVDFNHFNGNQTSFSGVEFGDKFQLLPYYEFSSTNSFVTAHYEHHFNEFIFNKIPLVKKLNLQAVASANYLHSESIGDYLELGAGIEHIFKFMRVDYWWAFRNGNRFANGLTFGIGF